LSIVSLFGSLSINIQRVEYQRDKSSLSEIKSN